MSGPLRQIVTNFHDSLAVKDVAGWSERIRHFSHRSEIEQGGKGKPHAATFISDRGSALATTDLTGQDTLADVSLTVKEAQIFRPGNEPDMMLVKNDRPLHGRTVQDPAGPAVTDLRIDRVGAYLIPYRAAETGRLVFRDEVRVAKDSVFGAKLVFNRRHLHSF